MLETQQGSESVVTLWRPVAFRALGGGKMTDRVASGRWIVAIAGKFGSLFSAVSRRSSLLAALLLAALCGSCATAPTVTTPRSMQCQQPNITLLSEQTPAQQRRGDITITAAIDPALCEDRVSVSYEQTEAPSGLGGFLAAVQRAGGNEDEVERYYERTERRGPFAPERYGFLLTIVNQSPRVFRGDGAVVQYQVDGVDVAVSDVSYSGFMSSIVLPGRQTQVAVSDIAHTDISDGAAIGLFLYDVIVERDDAGVPTRRENFEWFFSLNREVVTGPGAETTCTYSQSALPGGRPQLAVLLTQEQLSSDPLSCAAQ